MTAAVDGWLKDQDVQFYCSGINDWQTGWNNHGLVLEGDYVNKIKQYESKLLAISVGG